MGHLFMLHFAFTTKILVIFFQFYISIIIIDHNHRVSVTPKP